MTGGVEAQPTEAEMGLLAALADGSLPDSRRADAEALLERSPALLEVLGEQRRAVTGFRSLNTAAPRACVSASPASESARLRAPGGQGSHSGVASPECWPRP